MTRISHISVSCSVLTDTKQKTSGYIDIVLSVNHRIESISLAAIDKVNI